MIAANAALWPVFVPMLTAALSALAWGRPRLQPIVSGVGAAAMLAASLYLLARVTGEGTQTVQFGNWPAPFGIVFVADRLGAAMVAIAGVMAVVALVYALADLRRREVAGGFHPLFHGLLAGVNGAFLTGDIFNLYVWFEVMLITAMGLLALGRTKARLDGVLRYAILNLFSTLLFLLAVALLYGTTGTLNLAELSRVVPDLTPSVPLVASGLLLLVAFGIKAGYFPLFFWLPASYHTASIAVMALFAGLLTKVGVYATYRVFTEVFALDTAGMGQILAVLAAGTMIVGVLGAAVQWDIRRILAFHIVSQIGYMVMGLALMTQAGLAAGIFYIVHHIVVKANLFLVAGAIHRAGGSYDLRAIGGLGARAPLLAALFLVPALSLAGIPPFSGFWAKYMVVDAGLAAGASWLVAAALVTGLLTLYSMTKIWTEAFAKPAPSWRTRARPVPVPMLAASGALGALTLAMSLWPEPFIAFAGLAAGELGGMR